MSIDIVPAHLAVQAMRDNGYKNAAYAIAELIDNSIQAGATVVELLCAERTELVNQRSRPRIYQVAVLDNGSGMDASVLTMALQFGNGMHLSREQQNGMGKFGMGLPNASISQCTKVEVWSWQNGPESALYTYLDVDKIRNRQQTFIPEPKLCPIPPVWFKVGTAFEQSGTLVVWSNLDRIAWRTASTIIDNSEFLVGRLYRRFLADGRVKIKLVAFDADNPQAMIRSRLALPNDPGYLMARTSCPPPWNDTPMFQPWGGEESYEVTHIIQYRGERHPVRIRFSYAKEEARQAALPGSLPHGQHAAKNVGVSVVRAERELELDDSWTIKYNPVERWWGVEVEFPPALDDIFGVTNNKQTARTFADLHNLDMDALLDGRSKAEAIDELIAEHDPRAPLLEIAQTIQSNIRVIRGLLTQQTRGTRTKTSRYNTRSAEAVATEATRELQREGHKGASDKEEELPPQQQEERIVQSLVDEGVEKKAAEQLAAQTVSAGWKYAFAEADLETPAFFAVKLRGGKITILINTNHPAYTHLLEVLEQDETSELDATKLQERLGRASEGLKLLLAAWARYEDEQLDALRPRAQQARTEWGIYARRFLERED